MGNIRAGVLDFFKSVFMRFKSSTGPVIVTIPGPKTSAVKQFGSFATRVFAKS